MSAALVVAAVGALAVRAVVVLAQAVLARPQVVAPRAHRVPLPRVLLLLPSAKAHRPVRAAAVLAPALLALVVPEPLVLAARPVLAVPVDLVVARAVLRQHLLSHRSSSAAMARNSLPPRATSEPVPR